MLALVPSDNPSSGICFSCDLRSDWGRGGSLATLVLNLIGPIWGCHQRSRRRRAASRQLAWVECPNSCEYLTGNSRRIWLMCLLWAWNSSPDQSASMLRCCLHLEKHWNEDRRPSKFNRICCSPLTHYCNTIHVSGHGTQRSVPTGLRRWPRFATRAPRMTEKPAEGNRRSHWLHTSECGHHWATAGLWHSAEVWQFLQAKAWRLVQHKACLLDRIHAKGCVLHRSQLMPHPIEKMCKCRTDGKKKRQKTEDSDVLQLLRRTKTHRCSLAT